MTPSEVAAILRQFNEWRRVPSDGWREHPTSKEITEAIDVAAEMLERMRDVEVALREIAWSNNSKWKADRARSVLEESK